MAMNGFYPDHPFARTFMSTNLFVMTMLVLIFSIYPETINNFQASMLTGVIHTETGTLGINLYASIVEFYGYFIKI
jgi:hypothetical protein